METPPEHAEDLADLIQWIMDNTGDSASAIARKVGVSPALVSNWHNRKRGTGRGPAAKNLRNLAAAYNLPEKRVFAAVQQKVPGPLPPDAKERLLKLFDQLTEEQQQLIETQVRAVAEGNRPPTS